MQRVVPLKPSSLAPGQSAEPLTVLPRFPKLPEYPYQRLGDVDLLQSTVSEVSSLGLDVATQSKLFTTFANDSLRDSYGLNMEEPRILQSFRQSSEVDGDVFS